MVAMAWEKGVEPSQRSGMRPHINQVQSAGRSVLCVCVWGGGRVADLDDDRFVGFKAEVWCFQHVGLKV